MTARPRLARAVLALVCRVFLAGLAEVGRSNPWNRCRGCVSRIRSQTLPFWQPTDPNGTTSDPNGTTTDPNGTTSDPNGTTSDPNGTSSDPNGTTTDPQYDGKS